MESEWCWISALVPPRPLESSLLEPPKSQGGMVFELHAKINISMEKLSYQNKGPSLIVWNQFQGP